MLSSVLNSERAILVNIQIMRAFTKLRKILASYAEIRRKVEKHDVHLEEHDVQIKVVFDAIKSLMSPPAKEMKKIGFTAKQA